MSKKIIVLICILITLASCTKDDHMMNTPTNTYTPAVVVTPVTTDTTLRSYLALGDSYTIGQSVTVEERYPVQTVKYLLSQGLNFTTPEIIAQTGWTTSNLISSMVEYAPLKSTYDIVTLLIGVNNQYQHKNKEEYAAEFLTLLNMAIKYANNKVKRVIVLSVPDYSVTPFASGSDKAAIAIDIDAFNAINKKISDSAGVNYLDVTTSSRFAANDPTLIASDGLHPSGIEYNVWAKSLFPIIIKVLQ